MGALRGESDESDAWIRDFVVNHDATTNGLTGKSSSRSSKKNGGKKGAARQSLQAGRKEEACGFYPEALSASLAIYGATQAMVLRRGIARGIAVGRTPCKWEDLKGSDPERREICWIY